MGMFTYKEKLDCALREVSKRKHVYPRLIESGKLAKYKADHEINCMQEIADDYQKLVEQHEQLPLGR